MRKVISKEAISVRIQRFTEKRNEMMKDVDSLHVKLQPGNSKTGNKVWTVSLMPVLDCKNCSECKWDCYDIKNVLIHTRVVHDRCRNSVIHKLDVKRFWNEIDMQVKCNYVTELRLNVGGDLNDDDFKYVKELGINNPKTRFLFFTKNYKGINAFLAEDSFPENVHPIMSAWCGMEMDNPNNLPEAHVLYEDGRTTAPEFGSHYCGGNCSECAFNEKGCWTLKQGDSVIFRAH